ncbi:prespore-specific protein [Tieghemostelium lacteum]|uniref:Prespore-specific protein n=1 Tax=Tieghemostelium lacteum TaxID=361077 RepID=A0A151ZFW6_TIELA|nr:prespore-specific protein [Tieghemostelium lacteum]|eukprot:KYQ92872.1 prespore-specific protein [Tieghemostelium lacteum]
MSENFELLGNPDEGEDQHQTSSVVQQPLALQPIYLTPEQQHELAEHLSPTLLTNISSPPNIVGTGSSTGNLNSRRTSPILEHGTGILTNVSPRSTSSKSSTKSNQNVSPTLKEKDKDKKKKKKDKKKKKKKDRGTDSSSDDNDSRISDISSNHHHETYSLDDYPEDGKYTTEMSNFDNNNNNNNNFLNKSGNIIQRINSEIGGGDMYFGGSDGSEKKKKKKKKKGGKDEELTPEERRIKEEAKDAKSFFSNERTFLSWIGLTFSLGAIGTAIITWFGTEGVSLATGLFLWITAILFMAYSTLQFRRRGNAIRNKTQGPFDDQKGPLALIVMVVIGVSIYLVFFVAIRPSANINIGGGGNRNNTH